MDSSVLKVMFGTQRCHQLVLGEKILPGRNEEATTKMISNRMKSVSTSGFSTAHPK